MPYINQIDIETVTDINKLTRKLYNPIRIASLGKYTQNMLIEEHTWQINGTLDTPTQMTIDRLQSFRNTGKIVLIDLDDIEPNTIAWGKITDLNFSSNETRANMIDYEMTIQIQPAIGYTTSQKNNIKLYDLEVNKIGRYIDPHFGRFSKSYSSDRKTLQYQFKILNIGDSAATPEIEIQIGDNISSLTITSDAGTWNSGTGERGTQISVGTETKTLSLMLGCLYRGYGIHPSTLAAGASETVTVTITHSAFPYTTYIEGGVNE